jgi:hypothetical protein
MAGLALYVGFSFPGARVITTAPTWRQVQDILWAEINRMAVRAGLVGQHFTLTEFRLTNGSHAQGISTDNPVNFQGVHAPTIVVLMDEGPGIEPGIWEVIFNGIAVSEGASVVAVGNPVEASGPFHKVYVHARANTNGRWKARVLSCFEHPNVMNREPIVEGAVSYSHCADMMRVGGEVIEDLPELARLAIMRARLLESGELKNEDAMALDQGVVYFEGGYYNVPPIIQCRVLGQFPTSGPNSLFDVNLVAAAMRKGEEALAQYRKDQANGNLDDNVHYSKSRFCSLAVDVAREGADKTVIGVRRGPLLLQMLIYDRNTITQAAGRAIAAYRQFDCELATVDVGAVGAGCYDMMAEATAPDGRTMRVEAFDFGAKAVGGKTEEVKYRNRRAQAYWHLRELLERGAILLPYNEEVMDELCSLRYLFDREGGRIQIESKRDIKARGATSPDRADCLAMLYEQYDPDGGSLRFLEIGGAEHRSVLMSTGNSMLAEAARERFI